jgi:galactose-1-phosphate uridylyltransferase
MNGWEQRWHPLREEWVIIAAHRQERPWHGERLGGPASSQAPIPEYAADCYLCPGNPRFQTYHEVLVSGLSTSTVADPMDWTASRVLLCAVGCEARRKNP